MNRIFSFAIVVLASLGFSFTITAQDDYVNAVWVLNEGVQDWTTGEMTELASVGVYDPVSQMLTEVMGFEGSRFTTDIIVAEGAAFIGADNKIVKMNLNTFVKHSVSLQNVSSTSVKF